MKTLIIYFDESKRNFQKITPFAQGAEFSGNMRFDGNWHDLVTQLTGGTYYKFEIV